MLTADAGYTGVEKREENQGKSVTWPLTMKPGKRRVLPDSLLGNLLKQIEKAKVSVRAKVERPFHIVIKPLQAPEDPLPWIGQVHLD